MLLRLEVPAFVRLLSASRLSLGADLVPIGHQVVTVKVTEGMQLSMVPTVSFDSLGFVIGYVVLHFALLAAEVVNTACKI